MHTMKGTIRESKFIFYHTDGFRLYIDVGTGDSTGFAHVFRNEKEITDLLIRAGERSWCSMDAKVLIGKEVEYDYDEKTNRVTFKRIIFDHCPLCDKQ